MKKSYYLFNPGRISRTDNTLKFTMIDEFQQESSPKYIPIESVDNLYVFGSLDANSALYNFLGKEQISVHYFDYYEHYTGSFMPKEYLLAGKMLVAQTDAYTRQQKRMAIAQKFVQGAASNMIKNLKYYNNRDKDTSNSITRIEMLMATIDTTSDIDVLMGIEGNIRMSYYESFDIIINDF